jgi:hypothetical protein
MPVELRVRQAYHHGRSDDGLQCNVSRAATTSDLHGGDELTRFAPI